LIQVTKNLWKGKITFVNVRGDVICVLGESEHHVEFFNIKPRGK